MLKTLLVTKNGTRPAGPAAAGLDIELHEAGLPLGEKILKNSYDLILLEEEIKLLPEIKSADPRVEVIVYGGEREDETVAIRLGAAAFVPGPVDDCALGECIDGVRELVATRKETAELEGLLEKSYSLGGMVGRNPQMLDIFSFLRRIAPYYKTVTIMGETGTGKEEVARALHSVSPLSDEPFIPCNCGALVEHLIESEFFGHKKGSFTGAIADKPGIFEAAGEGTVFLDEVGDLPLSFQPHLLRVLQNGDFRRLGSNETLQARCRVVAATNRDLAADVRAGRFREDLYFRLTPLTITLPPLRERKDDISLLHRFLLKKFCKRTGKRILGISRDAQRALISYDWPGNVRELENVIEQIAILTENSFIRDVDLPKHIRQAGSYKSPVMLPLDTLVKRHIEAALTECGGNRTHAARMLGISRRALIRKIEKYSIGRTGRNRTPAKTAHRAS